MNKHLNNWLDQVEGLPINTSNNNIEQELKNSDNEKDICYHCNRDLDPIKDNNCPHCI